MKNVALVIFMLVMLCTVAFGEAAYNPTNAGTVVFRDSYDNVSTANHEIAPVRELEQLSNLTPVDKVWFSGKNWISELFVTYRNKALFFILMYFIFPFLVRWIGGLYDAWLKVSTKLAAKYPVWSEVLKEIDNLVQDETGHLMEVANTWKSQNKNEKLTDDQKKELQKMVVSGTMKVLQAHAPDLVHDFGNILKEIILKKITGKVEVHKVELSEKKSLAPSV